MSPDTDHSNQEALARAIKGFALTTKPSLKLYDILTRNNPIQPIAQAFATSLDEAREMGVRRLPLFKAADIVVRPFRPLGAA